MKRRDQRARGDDVWVRWHRGERIAAIARAHGVSDRAIRKRVRRWGGIAPVARTRSARVLTSAEREEISRGLAAGQSFAAVARGLGRPTPRSVARSGAMAAAGTIGRARLMRRRGGGRAGRNRAGSRGWGGCGTW